MNDVKILPVPKGWARFKWLGPAFIWMLSAAGSGELLFTPLIGAQYGYLLVWAMLCAVLLKWFVNREIGRYTVCTGAAFLTGLAQVLKGRLWLLWLLLLPQIVVAVATVAGLAGAAATAITVFFNTPSRLTVGVTISLVTGIVTWGPYKTVEKVITILAIAISISILAAALSTQPQLNALMKGFYPRLPNTIKYTEVLPWLGFLLAGAAGLMWFSYWIKARGYGMATEVHSEPVAVKNLKSEQIQLLKGWIKQMSYANTIAVIGALLIAFAFLILGTELLKPKKLVPQEDEVATTLGQLMGSIWGQAGFVFMVVAVFVTFISTMISSQDGYSRMFADAANIMFKKKSAKNLWFSKHLKKMITIVLLGILPIIVYTIVGEPIALLKLSGSIEAAHIPIVIIFILYLNHVSLPKALRPSVFTFLAVSLAGMFFTAFAVIYFIQVIKG